MNKDKKWRPTRKWKEPPYYKVQYYDEKSIVWKDDHDVFDTLEEAEAFCKENTHKKRKRIMLVDAKNERIILGEYSN